MALPFPGGPPGFVDVHSAKFVQSERYPDRIGVVVRIIDPTTNTIRVRWYDAATHKFREADAQSGTYKYTDRRPPNAAALCNALLTYESPMFGGRRTNRRRRTNKSRKHH